MPNLNGAQRVRTKIFFTFFRQINDAQTLNFGAKIQILITRKVPKSLSAMQSERRTMDKNLINVFFTFLSTTLSWIPLELNQFQEKSIYVFTITSKLPDLVLYSFIIVT